MYSHSVCDFFQVCLHLLRRMVMSPQILYHLIRLYLTFLVSLVHQAFSALLGHFDPEAQGAFGFASGYVSGIQKHSFSRIRRTCLFI